MEEPKDIIDNCKIICSSCNTKNSIKKTNCYMCGKYLNVDSSELEKEVVKYNKKKFNMHSIIFIIWIIVAILSIDFCVFNSFNKIFLVLFIISVLMCIIHFAVSRKYLSEEDKKRIQKEKIEAAYRDTIDYTIIAGTDSRKSATSSIVKGAVGGALFGMPGVIGGALSGESINKTTFTIVYKDGHRVVETVDNNSSKFNKYAKYLR